MKSQSNRIAMTCLFVLTKFACGPVGSPVIDQTHAAATITDDLDLGRVTVINSSKNCTVPDETLYLISGSQFDFDVDYKIEDGNKWTIHNNRATASLDEETDLTSLEWNQVWWRSVSRSTSWNPRYTYKVEGTFSGSTAQHEFARRYIIWQKAQSGRINPKTCVRRFTVAKNPSQGGELLVVTRLANEVAHRSYGTFLDHMEGYIDGTVAKAQLQAAVAKLHGQAVGYIEYYDLYSNPTYQTILLIALSEVSELVGSALMLYSYVNNTKAILDTLTDTLEDAFATADLRYPMRAAKQYLQSNSCGVDPQATADAARQAIHNYGYARSLSKAQTASQLATARTALETYHTCVVAAHQVFDDEVLARPMMADKDELRAIGEDWFTQQQMVVRTHIVALEVLRQSLLPSVCGDGVCAADESCASCSQDCCGPDDACVALPFSPTPAASVHLDYRDDTLVKHVYIDEDDAMDAGFNPWNPATHTGALQWDLQLNGRAFRNYSTSQPGIDVTINGDRVCSIRPHQHFPTTSFATRTVCQDVWQYRIQPGGSVTFSGPLRVGWNEITLRTNSHWDYNGLWVGLDRDYDCNRSAWDNSWQSNPDPATDAGELMITQQVAFHD